MISATVKTVLTPIAIVKDVVNVATGEEVSSTEDLIDGIVDDVSDGMEDLCDGDL